MHILVSNDDGYFSAGIHALVKQLEEFATVTVVAPEQDRSGASNSLTLDRPLSVRQAASGFYYVNGTPTDCVHLAVTGLIQQKPDLVISGINHGANMGEDTLYSGTVAAAMEGFLLGIPSIALSLAAKHATDFSAASFVVKQIMERYLAHPFHAPVLLNVNIPDVSVEHMGSFEVTRLGRRHKAEPVIEAKNPRGQTVYWIGPVGKEQDAGLGTDFYAINQGNISVTPLMVDLTAHQRFDDISHWLYPSDH